MNIGREAKLRRLNALRRRLPYASASAISALLDDVAEHGIPDSHSRRDIRESRDAIVNTKTPFGPLLTELSLIPDVDGDENPTLCIAHPLAMIWYATFKLQAWQKLFLDRLATHPSTQDAPWSLIMYSDEVTPGDPLSANIGRKVQCIYYSFLELGTAALSREDAWFHAAIKRTTDCKDVANSPATL